MHKIKLIILLSFLSSSVLANCPDILNHEVRILDSKETQSLCEYKNKVILAVNVASRCGYTPQYTGLQTLYKDLQDKDFVVLAFPSRDFMWQEFNDESDIKEFWVEPPTLTIISGTLVEGKKELSFLVRFTTLCNSKIECSRYSSFLEVRSSI